MFLTHWNRLGIPDLGVNAKYQDILQNYGRDLEMVSNIYAKQKLDPPIARNMPAVAGRIMWARQLYSRIQGPMDLFQKVFFNLFQIYLWSFIYLFFTVTDIYFFAFTSLPG